MSNIIEKAKWQVGDIKTDKMAINGSVLVLVLLEHQSGENQRVASHRNKMTSLAEERNLLPIRLSLKVRAEVAELISVQ